MWFNAPIYESQFNDPAKLYKRFTNDMEIRLNTSAAEKKSGDKTISVPDDVVVIQDNRYVQTGSLQWADATDRQDGEYQPINGLIVKNEYKTIKYNGPYRSDSHSLIEPQVGDILKIDDEFWIIESPIQRVRNRSMRNLATVYLQLQKVAV